MSSIEQIREGLHISHSQISTFLLCPQSYCYQYVEAVPWESTPAALVFGGSVHKTVAHLYRRLKNDHKKIAIEEFLQFFRDAWGFEAENVEAPLRFKKGESLGGLTDRGAAMLEIFYNEVNPQTVVSVEEPFSVPIPESDISLVGVFDLIEADSDGTNVICELKTSAQKWSESKLQYDLQGTIYSWALSEMNGQFGETLIRYDILTKNSKPSLESYHVVKDETDHARMLDLVKQILSAIEKGAFFRRPDWGCSTCQFFSHCKSQ